MDFFDLGGHRFITKDQEIQTMLEELMGNEFSCVHGKVLFD